VINRDATLRNPDNPVPEADVLTFDRFVVGHAYGSMTDTPDATLVERWRRLYPQDEFPSDCAPPGMATVLMMRAYMHLLSPRPPGNIHARQQMTLGEPIRLGDSVSTEITCLGKEIRRDRRYVTVRAHGTNPQGATCFVGVLTLIWAA
jgi:hypothetical protein